MNINNFFSKIFPIIDWFPSITKSDIVSDLFVGLTVGTMLIPQSISYADIAGLTPEYGMYSCLLPPFIYVFMGSSRYLSIGPVALVSLLVSSGLEDLVDNSVDPDRYVELTTLLSLQVGLFQFIGSLVQAHHLIVVLGEPVISGFTSAASIIIGMSQMKHLLGYDIPKSHYITTTLSNLFTKLDETNGLSLCLGIIWFSIIFLINKYSSQYKLLKQIKIVTPLTMCLIGILIINQYNLDDKLKVVGYIPEGLPKPKWLVFRDFTDTLGTAFTISFISYLESISIAKTLTPDEIDESAELRSLGVCNIIGSFFGAYPVAGSFSRTAVNHTTGSKTQISGCFTSLVIIFTLTLLTNFFSKLPKYGLSAIIINSVMRLFDYQQAKYYYQNNKIDFVIWIITFLGCLFLGVLVGLLIAIGFSFLIIIYHHTYPQLLVIDQYKTSVKYKNICVIKLVSNHINYINIPYILRQIKNLTLNLNDPKFIILDLDSVITIDTTALEKFKDLKSIIFTNYSKKLKKRLETWELELVDDRDLAMKQVVKKTHSKLRLIL